MSTNCAFGKPVVVGRGAPERRHDPDEEAPVYLDLVTKQVWVAVGGTWLPVHVPLSWFVDAAQEPPLEGPEGGQSAVSPLDADDWITVGTGSPGHFDENEYLVSTVGELVAMVKRHLRLNDLNDVDAPAPGDNDALVFDGTRWVAGLIRYVLDDFTDVSAPAPNINDILVMRNHRWVPEPLSRALDELVDVSAQAPQDGALLEKTDGGWQARVQLRKLDDLSDVAVPAPARHDVLVYDGTTWRASFAREAVSAWCASCASGPMPEAQAVGYLFDPEAGLFKIAGDRLRMVTGANVVVCVNTGRVYAMHGGAWREMDLVTEAGHNIVMSVIAAPTVDDAIAAGLQPGNYWLQDDGVTRSLRYFCSGDTAIEAVQVVNDIAVGLRPKAVVATNACRLYIGLDDSTGGFSIVPIGPHARQVCVDPCEGSPWTTQVDLQTALCMITGAGDVQVGPCEVIEGPPPIVSSTMRLSQALCLLDQALQKVRNLIQDPAGAITVPACPSGPVNASMTLQEAICALSAAAATASVLPLPAASVTMTPCPSGPANASTNAQDALCAIADSLTVGGTIQASSVTVQPCPTGPASSATNLQDALCAFSNTGGGQAVDSDVFYHTLINTNGLYAQYTGAVTTLPGTVTDHFSYDLASTRGVGIWWSNGPVEYAAEGLKVNRVVSGRYMVWVTMQIGLQTASVAGNVAPDFVMSLWDRQQLLAGGSPLYARRYQWNNPTEYIRTQITMAAPLVLTAQETELVLLLSKNNGVFITSGASAFLRHATTIQRFGDV